MKAIYTGTHYQAIAKTGKSKGTLIDQFVYLLDGTEEEIEQYKEKADSYFKLDSDTGKPLYWSQEPIGDIAEMRFSKKGNLNPETPSDIAFLRTQVKKHKDTPSEAIFAKMYADAVVQAFAVTDKKRASVKTAVSDESTLED